MKRHKYFVVTLVVLDSFVGLLLLLNITIKIMIMQSMQAADLQQE